MYIHRLNKESLAELCNEQGYKICVCKNDKEQVHIYEGLKGQGKCARAAIIKNKEGKYIKIVVTKEDKRGVKANEN